eukprot:TRINITY_DN4545_c0_g1_i2.p1 TRINITY_DN4545_c0_g1~~TRINITY_DN4545_c0_g1_i2.p1  ORF type:complete len:532 (+),score=82.32 TRINITY_DN4545_c0_g1_i2:97-1596(+)
MASSGCGKRTLLRASTFAADGGRRPCCRYGAKCFRANPEHLAAEAHPADKDYLECCRQSGKKPEFVSVRKLFEWCDANGTGRAEKKELQEVWDVIAELGQDVGDLDDALWEQLDDDGNGYINFGEFAEFTTKNGVNLPLGLDDLLGTNDTAALRCGVYDPLTGMCPCKEFRVVRRRCKYGAECYQSKQAHRDAFCHPGDDDWEVGARTANMCICGHKHKLHMSAAEGAGAVTYPSYWSAAETNSNSEFNDMVPNEAEVAKFQQIVNDTYSDKTTRDRRNHHGSWMVPRDFTVVNVHRSENSKLWRKYCIRKAELQAERRLAAEDPEAERRNGIAEFVKFDDVATSKSWGSLSGESLDGDINEWYLFHGTSKSAAKNICSHDFKMRLAGSATGTLYGRGSYLAESITKADEYAKSQENGECTVLLCRVLGGRVRYTDERTPDPDELTRDCMEGPYDCIVGDRKKISGTYREFVVFDTENVYPEFVITYTRGELFKSDSHP